MTMIFSLSEDVVIVCSESCDHFIFGAEVDSSSSLVYLNGIKSLLALQGCQIRVIFVCHLVISGRVSDRVQQASV